MSVLPGWPVNATNERLRVWQPIAAGWWECEYLRQSVRRESGRSARYLGLPGAGWYRWHGPAYARDSYSGPYRTLEAAVVGGLQWHEWHERVQP